MLALNSGLHVVGRERRRHRDRTTRLLAFVDTFTEATALGLKEHDRPAFGAGTDAAPHQEPARQLEAASA
ncbi:DUF1612 domain-containing protein [Mesorhizobium sp. M0954]|uniref:DUF1612 domain-containing protein n=1 Tax=Mesorhizobium sp. M0954 TaxID=2957032 RepID=UPI00333AA7F1